MDIPAHRSPLAAARRRRWPGFPVRKLLPVFLFLVAAIVQYRLATLPSAVNMSDISPVSAQPGQELVLYGVDPAGPLLSYTGRIGEAVDVRFDKARLAPETVELLRNLGLAPAAAEGAIAWITATENAAKTVLEVRQATPGGSPIELRLRPLSGVSPKQPQLEAEAHGATLEVLLGTPHAPELAGAQSSKRLTVNGEPLALAGTVPVKIRVADGTSFRARFSSIMPGWLSEGVPFLLGALPLPDDEATGLAARALGVRPAASPTRSFDLYACATRAGALAWQGLGRLIEGDCSRGAGALLTTDLKVGADWLRVNLAGTGWAQRDRQPLGETLLARLGKNPALTALIGTANMALVGWMLAAVFPRLLPAGLRLRPAARWSGGVFLSYRREDAAPHAGRLYDRLSTHFGADRVFMDVGGIQPGEDFARVIAERIGSADALLAIIGKGWLAAANDQGQRRLDDPKDFVRIEIATALAHGTRVIPVLVGGAVMPPEQALPESLAPLAKRNAVELSDNHFGRDVEALITALEQPVEATR